MISKIHENILNQPGYWVEAINGMLYEAITEYMKSHKINRAQMAEYLGISRGRMSQILNDGDINFSIEKLVEIALKVGKYPVIQFEDKETCHQDKQILAAMVKNRKTLKTSKENVLNTLNNILNDKPAGYKS